MEMKWEKLKWNYCYVKHEKNPETDAYGRDRSGRSENLERREITIREMKENENE